ncbi:hypothetical protein M404DRAFT_993828 [Pisolithus tinctorius Marx 270]|uniref:Uncharacterized protein n=1 Tax=Pisolithus tinctorius Marx 270 TaxID=870435 RepID=A0A0C3JUR1_PISTI|nr:hypothetical protein M404DRAFT_993828 [Pisolithus tinctorius Marx 270]
MVSHLRSCNCLFLLAYLRLPPEPYEDVVDHNLIHLAICPGSPSEIRLPPAS